MAGTSEFDPFDKRLVCSSQVAETGSYNPYASAMKVKRLTLDSPRGSRLRMSRCVRLKCSGGANH